MQRTRQRGCFASDANPPHANSAGAFSGLSQSITITNAENRLSAADIQLMAEEAENFAKFEDQGLDLDAAKRDRLEAFQSMATIIRGLKNRLRDSEGLGMWAGAEYTQTLEALVQEIDAAEQWIGESATGASARDLTEKLTGTSKYSLSLRNRS